jgi:lipid A ethanolaminephosphotransferase
MDGSTLVERGRNKTIFPTWQRPTLSAETILAATACWLVAFGNGPWWSAVMDGRSPTSSQTWLFVGALFLVLAAVHFILLALPAVRLLVKPLAIAALVATAAANYYMRTYAVILDPEMMRNVVRTDWRESRELMTAGAFLSVLLWAALPVAVVLAVRVRETSWRSATGWRAGSLVLALLLFALGALALSRDLVPLMRERHELRYLITPANTIYALLRNARADARSAAAPRAVVGADARRSARWREAYAATAGTSASAAPGATVGAPTRPRVFVFVLGETARAANFGLLGYARDTTPELRKLGVLAYSDVTSCGTSTEVSVPCMFSAWGRADYDEARIRGSESVLNVLARAGIDVRWLDNQSGCKGVCEGNGIVYRKLDASYAPDLCHGEDCYDEILLRGLRDTLRIEQGNGGPVRQLQFGQLRTCLARLTSRCGRTAGVQPVQNR